MQNITTKSYWNARYSSSSHTSGTGSYGQLAAFKAMVLNDFIKTYDIKNMSELGCGDGHQLGLLNIPKYFGYDIAEKAVEICKEIYSMDYSKTFDVYNYDSWKYKKIPQTELSVSLDVIYHLIEDDTYHNYLTSLFDLSTRFVIIYSNNTDIQHEKLKKHVRYHKFTDWVKKYKPEWVLAGYFPNKYPPCRKENIDTSIADFYFFTKGEKLNQKYGIFFNENFSKTNQNIELAADFMNQGRLAIDTGDRVKAVDFFEKVVEYDNDNIFAMNNLGYALRFLGRVDEAEKAFKAAIANDNLFIPSRIGLTKLYLNQNRWDDLNHFYMDVDLLIKNSPNMRNLLPFFMTKIEFLRYV